MRTKEGAWGNLGSPLGSPDTNHFYHNHCTPFGNQIILQIQGTLLFHTFDENTSV